MKKLLALVIVFNLLGCSKDNQIEILPGIDIELAKYRKANINTIEYDLDFRIPADRNQPIQGYEILTFNLLSVERDVLIDFNVPTENLQGIIVNGEPHGLDHRQEHLVIAKGHLKEGFNKIEVNFFVGETSLNRQEEFLYTLFVPDRARTAFPVFDQPNLKAKYKLTLDIPQDWRAISNAPVELMKVNDGRKNLVFAQSDLMSSYLFSFVAGEFESINMEIDGRQMTMLHRETDEEKVNRNRDEIFRLHAAALQWMEAYTGIKYPFQKFDFALIPGFQYGGMEHVGAIQYRANSLLLDEDPSQNQLLSRASLIGHETAHMWFGDLVTMDWFNDVWTKEVFANFMAAKMVNPSFPEIDHDLNFLVRHYPSAFGVDRTEGANPIRQELLNLNEAGQMYGAIIYNKAPIMMRQLEILLGEDEFRAGMQSYLKAFANKNATWPDLINILDQRTPIDLNEWSEVWVNSPGRPHFNWQVDNNNNGELAQMDPYGEKVWPQVLSMKLFEGKKVKEFQLASSGQAFEVALDKDWRDASLLTNSDAIGYGLFPVDYEMITARWSTLSDLEKGSLLINAYENLLEVSNVGEKEQYSPERYLETLKWIMIREQNQLIIRQVLSQTGNVFWSLLTREQRERMAPDLERTLFHCLNDIHDDPAIKKQYFNAFRNVTITGVNTQRLYSIWKEELSIPGVRLSESDRISLAGQLAIRMPDNAEEIVNTQLESIQNPDAKRRFAFISDALSPDKMKRDEKFASFAQLDNRDRESWVLSALGYLHHPLRVGESVDYIEPSLALLQEIQITGDIFFPKRWLDVSLGNHSSDEALAIIDQFLADNPDYNAQLKMKILQAMDKAKRANRLQKAWGQTESLKPL